LSKESGRVRGGMIVRICSHCKEDNTLKKRDSGLDSEHYYCSHCKAEKWPDETETYKYGIGSYINAKGVRKYSHHNYRKDPDKGQANAMQLKKARRVLRGMSKRDSSLLRRIRRNR